MNSASQDFPHHLDVLRVRMLHPTDYELAINYFLEEFAGDAAFVRGSEPEPGPHLVTVLNIVVSKAMLMLIPGIRGQMDVARFHLKGGLPDRGGIEDQPSLPMALKECMNIATRPKLLQEVPSL
jgi:hypothetical protein